MIKYKILESGYCLQNEKNIILNGQDKELEFPARFVLLSHPEFGHILYDTGYSTRFYDAAKKFPYNIYAKITDVKITENSSAAKLLKDIGIAPVDIKYIIISHFHADHIGGLKDFPNARFLCLPDCYESIKNKLGFSALLKGFLPALMPDDFEKRLVFINNEIQTGYEYFNIGFDIFGDKSIIGFDISGHADGQLGLLFNDTFFVADAVWCSKAYKTNTPPPLFVRLLLGNNKKYLRTLNKLFLFHKKYPDIKIIPSHCKGTV